MKIRTFHIQIISAILPAPLIGADPGKLSCRRSKADKQGAEPRRIFQKRAFHEIFNNEKILPSIKALIY
jgi:hypothetical protein